MRARWSQRLNALRTGFWFVPMLMLALACGLALLLLYADERIDPGIRSSIPWAYSGGPEGARSLLSTIAGSMITAASVTFSLAAVALSISSQQYGSRVLRNFMRDRITQVLLGTFVSTFTYSVLVVRAIRGPDISSGFVPAVSVTVAIALSLASLILLIYFIHHVSASIQASHILRAVADDMTEAIPKLYPSKTGKPVEGSNEPDFRQGNVHLTATIPTSGYLQLIDLDALLEIATEQNLVIEVLVRPGDHYVKGCDAARIWGACKSPEKVLERILDAFQVGGERTPTQDIRFQFQQLTDVVVRALSPGINDPFTALNGIDELASGMLLLAERGRIADKRRDEKGVLRLTLLAPGIGEILDATVGHIAIYGAEDRFVMVGLRRVLDIVERHIDTAGEMEMLAHLRRDIDHRERENSWQTSSLPDSVIAAE